ncbi:MULTISPECIES: NUDIX hydrolase [Bacillus]|uniref:NUDIX hydrolase n=1 Tax=Bacillus TaxID=1386 RepID=UPI0020D21A48|nr:8-oxo-dGTP diphosphatase [Bacillus pseudomycoides]MED1594656.1 8-oxo-dGTP diphosphatase [Bacillus pseudomycoides]MED4711334.1 8-oxo-dGTP diphosphatase [Bacillus pseudomycoides]
MKRNDEILMLNKEYAPAKGLWNGVGGKIESGETPLESAICEIKEETDIDIKRNQIQFKGIITWEMDHTYSGGMYAYVVDVPNDFYYETPKKTAEGILDWRGVSWILSKYNYGVGAMIPHFLPKMLNEHHILEHRCVIINHTLVEYECKEFNRLDNLPLNNLVKK